MTEAAEDTVVEAAVAAAAKSFNLPMLLLALFSISPHLPLGRQSSLDESARSDLELIVASLAWPLLADDAVVALFFSRDLPFEPPLIEDFLLLLVVEF